MTGQLLASAVLLLGLAVVAGAGWPRVWLVLTLAGSGAAVAAAVGVVPQAAGWDWRSGVLLGGEWVHLRLDGLSALFLVLAAVVGGAGAVYSRGYWPDHHYPVSAPRGRAWWSALVLSMGLVLTVSNGLHFLMAWEAFAICGVFPDHAGSGRTARCARRAGCIWPRRMPGRSACSRFSPCWR